MFNTLLKCIFVLFTFSVVILNLPAVKQTGYSTPSSVGVQARVLSHKIDRQFDRADDFLRSLLPKRKAPATPKKPTEPAP